MSTANNEKSAWGDATEASANNYSTKNLPQQEGGKQLTAFMQIGKGQSVLVIGCGPGNDTLAIAELVGPTGHVEGIDLDKHSIAEADQALHQRPDIDPIVNHHVGNALDLSRFAGQKFDHVHINATYHWFSDKPLFFEGVVPLCKDGATIGIAGGNGNNKEPIFTIREQVCKELKLHPAVLFTYPSEAELRRDLPAAGFDDLTFKYFSKTFLHENTESLLDWLDVSTGRQYLGNLHDPAGKRTDEMLRHAKQRVLEEMEMFRLPTGQASMLVSRLMVKATFRSASA